MNRLKSKLKGMMLLLLFSAGVFAADAVTLDQVTWPTDNSEKFVVNQKGDARAVALTKQVAVDNDFVLEGTFTPAMAGQVRWVKVSIHSSGITPGPIGFTEQVATTNNMGEWKITVPKGKLAIASDYEVTVQFKNGVKEPVKLDKKHLIVLGGNQDPGQGPGPVIVTPPITLPPQ